LIEETIQKDDKTQEYGEACAKAQKDICEPRCYVPHFNATLRQRGITKGTPAPQIRPARRQVRTHGHR